jgi:hypothetical protein
VIAQPDIAGSCFPAVRAPESNLDKGFVELDGRQLVAHAGARLTHQFGTIVINANSSALPLCRIRLSGRGRCTSPTLTSPAAPKVRRHWSAAGRH